MAKQDLKRFDGARILHHEDSEQSFVFASQDTVGLVGNKDVNIVSSDEANMINGPLNIMAFPQDIRIGGLWALNPALIATVPSTLATPIPTFIYRNPGIEFLKDITSTINVMASFLK